MQSRSAQFGLKSCRFFKQRGFLMTQTGFRQSGHLSLPAESFGGRGAFCRSHVRCRSADKRGDAPGDELPSFHPAPQMNARPSSAALAAALAIGRLTCCCWPVAPPFLSAPAERVDCYQRIDFTTVRSSVVQVFPTPLNFVSPLPLFPLH